MRNSPSDIAALLIKNRYVLLLLLLGLLIILFTSGGGEEKAAEPGSRAAETRFSVEEEEKRLQKALSLIDGAGEVCVLLSVSGGVERTLALDEDGTVIVSAGNGMQEAVELHWAYPEYTGAVIVCAGADRASVRLAVKEAVMSFTGLGSDKITVIKGIK